jgi:hypothetical protein
VGLESERRRKCGNERVRDRRVFLMMQSCAKIIQGDSGGKVNILGGDSIGHCEEKSSYEHVPNSE